MGWVYLKEGGWEEVIWRWLDWKYDYYLKICWNVCCCFGGIVDKVFVSSVIMELGCSCCYFFFFWDCFFVGWSVL